MVNLLEETLPALKYNGKTPKDLLWVGDQYKKTTWEDFERISNFEYDGSEWWEFKEHPSCESSTFTKLLDARRNWRSGLDWGNEDET